MHKSLETPFNSCLTIINELVKSHQIPKDEHMLDHEILKGHLDIMWENISKIASNKQINIDKKDFLKKIKEFFFIVAEQNKSSIFDYELPDWLQASQNNCDEKRFDNYKKELIRDGMAGIVEQLDHDLGIILNKCHNPAVTGKWDRRGLVYGHVQSGKTANYVGLINRAFDHGYQIIIVLTGMTEDLRKQTQERVDKGIKMAVGEPFKINKGTTYGDEKMSGDFGRSTLEIQINNISFKEKSIWVIKKNKTVLEALIIWFYEQIKNQGGQTLKKCPVLIIDDEADNASVQSLSKKDFEDWEVGLELQKEDEDELTNKEKEDLKNAQEQVIKAINRNIRTLLSLIDQKTFVGYTATPYNIVVQEYEDVKERPVKIKHPISKIVLDFKISTGDLFPEHFIIPINPGKTYLGIERLFNEEDKKNIPAVINLNDNYDEDYDTIFPTKRGEDYEFDEIPQSLKDYIYYYVVAIIIKKHRGIMEHNTMLIHTSHLTKNADYVADKVADFIEKIRNGAVAGDKIILKQVNDTLKLIKKNSKNPLYNEYFNLKPTFPIEITFEDLFDLLKKNKDWSFEVVSYHSSKNPDLKHKFHNLDFGEKQNDEGKKKYTNYIVIGGNRLSRGLTLKGLIVSYFIRRSTRQDSLYQMGRWFGYRLGYEDLVRVLMPKDHVSWYNSVFRLEMDLRHDFEKYNDPDTPILPRNALIKLSNEINIEDLESNKKFPSICDPSKLRKTRVGTVTHDGAKQISSVILDKKVGSYNLQQVYKLFDDLHLNEIDKLFDYNKIPVGWEHKGKKNNHISFTNIPQNYVLTFLDNYKFHPENNDDILSFIDFIEKNENNVNGWSISLVNIGPPRGLYAENSYDVSKFGNPSTEKLFLVKRDQATKKINDLNGYTIRTLMDSPGVHTTFDIINKDNVKHFKTYTKEKYNLYRKKSKNPLMVIYPAKTKLKSGVIIEHPLIYLYYPRIDGLKKVRYIIKKDYE